MAVLYRKYRPQFFADIAGQEHVKTTLCEEVSSERLAHSYLFTGPRGIGKTTMARILAKAVNCQERQKGAGEPCGKCESCVQITEGRALDVVEIDAASHTGVDNVREQIIETARFKPTGSKYKVFVVDEVHMLSTSAFNALLKTLEEPPKHVMFILATTELHKLPATVVSRCQRFDFRKIGREDLVGRLQQLVEAEEVKVADDVLEMVARQSEGCLRDAESLLSQILSLGKAQVTIKDAAVVVPTLSSETVCELAVCLLTKDVAASLSVWEKLSVDGADLSRVVSDLTEIVRMLVLAKLKGKPFEPPFPLSTEWRKRFEGSAENLSAREGGELLHKMVRVRDEMKRTELQELPFEMMVMSWAQTTESVGAKQDNADDPPPPPVEPAQGRSDEQAAPKAGHKKDPANTITLQSVRNKWTEIVQTAQKKNQGLPYMLGAGELVKFEGNTLTIGFQYAMYRDRVNGKDKRMLEDALSEVMRSKVLIQAVLVEKREGIEADQKEEEALPDGFADLVKDFGGSLAS